jgi:uncharacterized protein
MNIFHRKSIILLWCIFTPLFAEFIVPSLPSTPVYDEVGLLSTEDKSVLENTILTLEKETNHQIGIAIIKSLQNRTIEEAGLQIARTW